jgi:hypothetical protein
MTRISKSNEVVKRFKVDFGAEILQAIDDVFDEILCSNQFVVMVESLIEEGEFDDAVYDRFVSGEGDLVNKLCDDCSEKCSDDCPGMYLKG